MSSPINEHLLKVHASVDEDTKADGWVFENKLPVSYEDSTIKVTFEKLEVYDTYTIAFNDLKAGAIDAIAIDVTSGEYLMGNVSGYKFLDEVLGSEQYGIGFRKGDTELRDKVNSALDELVKDGTYDKIGKKYPEIYNYLCLGK